MSQPMHAETRNSQAVALAEVPVLSVGAFADALLEQIGEGSALSALFGVPHGQQSLRLYGITSQTGTGTIRVAATDISDHYESFTCQVPQAHWFEREIAEQWGVVPEGHPWLKPIRFHRSYRPGHDAWGRSDRDALLPGVTDYFEMAGEEAHEVAVGPVHAGVIEPGHFRFQCHGEVVYSLEIELGYQHRGIERQLVGGPDKRTLHFMETLSGDTSIGHATAYSQAVEALAASEAPLRGQALRALSLELERLANHTGDLGALAQDVGFLPTASYCGRIRGDFLNTTAALCGNRFGRGLVRPGGVAVDADAPGIDAMRGRVEQALSDVTGAVELLWNSASAMARFEETGIVSRGDCDALGLVGVAARACGLDRDSRRDFVSGFYRFAQIPVSTWHTGDAFGRAYVRWLELLRSAQFVLDQLAQLPDGDVRHDLHNLAPESMVVSLVEGWRGEICHVALTDAVGAFAYYKIIDPSFHNWIGLAMSLRDQEISDFPLCNKSFNLSYCGHDL